MDTAEEEVTCKYCCRASLATDLRSVPGSQHFGFLFRFPVLSQVSSLKTIEHPKSNYIYLNTTCFALKT